MAERNGLGDAVLKVAGGFDTGDYRLFGTPSDTGKFDNRLEIYLDDDMEERHLMNVTANTNRYGRSTVEFSHIRDPVETSRGRFSYFGSVAEERILTVLSSPLEGGDAVMVAYENDEETAQQLREGCPPIATRLGRRMYLTGDFTWFNNLYYAEGGSEGQVKLMAERALDGEHRTEHLEDLRDEMEEFRERQMNGSEPISDALKNAEELAPVLDSRLKATRNGD